MIANSCWHVYATVGCMPWATPNSQAEAFVQDPSLKGQFFCFTDLQTSGTGFRVKALGLGSGA